MSEDQFTSRALKPASKEPDYWTYERASEPVRKLIDAEVEIARALGLNESLRNRLSRSVNLYLREIEEASEAPRVLQPNVRRRLKSIRTAASKLRKFFSENPKADDTRAYLRAWEDRGYGFDAITPDWKEALGDDLLGLQEAAAKMYKVLGRRSLYVDGQDVLFNSSLDVNDLCKRLDELCAFIDRQKKSKGGRPASDAWNKLMLSLADVYEDATGKQPTITENEHRAGVGERYSGQFMRVATLIDQATAGFCNAEARPNSALGPALRRLLKSRQNLRRSKTP